MFGFAPLGSMPFGTTGETPDTTAPELVGSIDFTNVTQTSFTATSPIATDNIGVTGYEYSLDGVTFTDNFASRIVNFPGRTAGTQYTVRFRAYDEAGNLSAVISNPVTTVVSADTTAPVMTGEITFSNITHNSFYFAYPAATDNIAVAGYEYSLNDGATYVDNTTLLNGTANGRSPSTPYSVRARAYDTSGNRSNALTKVVTTLVAPDVTIPVMLNQISVTNITANGFTVSFAGATDNVGVAGYEKSVGDTLNYVPIGTNLTFVETGKTASTSYTVNIRSFDQAGNYSLPITTLATTSAPVVVPTNPAPLFNGPAISNIAAAQSIAITPFNVSTRFSDTEAITFSQSSYGLAWPMGLAISQQGVISGSIAALGFNLGLRVRATDSVGQTVDSNAFNITVTAGQVNPVPTDAPAPNASQLHVGGSRTNFTPKRPQEVEILTIDFTPSLSFGETITQATWSMSVVRGIDPSPEAMLLGTAGIANELVSHFVQGGLPGVIYSPICAVTTSKGQIIVLPEPKSGLLRIVG